MKKTVRRVLACNQQSHKRKLCGPLLLCINTKCSWLHRRTTVVDRRRQSGILMKSLRWQSRTAALVHWFILTEHHKPVQWTLFHIVWYLILMMASMTMAATPACQSLIYTSSPAWERIQIIIDSTAWTTHILKVMFLWAYRRPSRYNHVNGTIGV